MRSKAHSIKCKSDNESKNKVKGVSESQSKHNKFEYYKKGLDGEDYQKHCDNYILRSPYLEIYPQKTKKSRLSLFVYKRCYEKNIRSYPWI